MEKKQGSFQNSYQQKIVRKSSLWRARSRFILFSFRVALSLTLSAALCMSFGFRFFFASKWISFRLIQFTTSVLSNGFDWCGQHFGKHSLAIVQKKTYQTFNFEMFTKTLIQLLTGLTHNTAKIAINVNLFLCALRLLCYSSLTTFSQRQIYFCSIFLHSLVFRVRFLCNKQNYTQQQ